MGAGTVMGELFDGRYRLEKRIGTGGMADVYLATDESLGRHVAIKILSDRYASDDAFVERFRREASSAAGLNHPNIVAVYDRGEAEGTYYIAMEYLDGPTLKDEITRRAPMPEPEAIGLATQALDALDFAHRRGVVHRDVKPHNMVMTADGRLKVTDFGIARAGNAAQMTEAGSIVGTAQYLSPEQARGQAVGPQSDLYSMGIVLYEMLTGELPFNGESAVEIAMKQVSDPPPSLHERNRLVSPGLEQVVNRSLAKDPALRHPSARAMADELRRVARGGAPSADTVQATQVISAYQDTQAATSVLRQAPPAAGTPSTKRSSLPWLLALLLLVVFAGVGIYVYQQLAGGSSVTIPSAGVQGATCAQAVQKLTSLGLDASTPCTTRASSADQKGKVIATTPAIGSSVDNGSHVTVIVGGGVATVKIPKLAGETYDTAAATLSGLGLKPNQVSIDSPAQQAGLVVGTDPGIGKTVPKGNSVDVMVASGFVKMPNVLGQSYNDAVAALKRRALAPNPSGPQEQPSSSVPDGDVISTSITSGTRVSQGTVITITVSSGPAPVQLPDYTGQTASAAKADAISKGFTVVINQTVVCDQNQNNIVQSQSPSGGSTQPAGTKVTLVVGKYDPTDSSCVQPPST